MRLVRYVRDGSVRHGRVIDSVVREYLPAARPGDEPAGPELELSDLQVLPPCTPTKLIIVAGNYRAHCEETGTPIPETPGLHPIPASCVTSHGSPIVLPPDIGRVDYEAELVIVIGKTCRGITPRQAREYIAGYTCGNDVSARDIQWGPNRALARAKSADTFTPLGPCLAVGLDPSDLLVEMRVSGELRQSSRTSDMIFSVEELVAEASRWMTLRPGDCILTGTPPGIAPLKAGDVCEVMIEGIGTLTNPVVAGT